MRQTRVIRRFFKVRGFAVQKYLLHRDSPLELAENVGLVNKISIRIVYLLIVDLHNNIRKNWMKTVVHKNTQRNWRVVLSLSSCCVSPASAVFSWFFLVLFFNVNHLVVFITMTVDQLHIQNQVSLSQTVVAVPIHSNFKTDADLSIEVVG